MRTLVIGPSGSGKTTLVKELLTDGSLAMDIDWFGVHAKSENAHGFDWIVPNRSMNAVFRNPLDVVVAGWCNNMLVNHQYEGYDYKAGKYAKLKEKPIAYSWDWDSRLVLVYDPTDEEYEARFNSGHRDNPFGKSREDWEKMKPWVEDMYFHPPKGFEAVDVTGVYGPKLRELPELAPLFQ